VASITQAVDTVRMYFHHRKLVAEAPPEIREEQIKVFREGAVYKLAQLYVVKVIWYALVILIAAYVARGVGVYSPGNNWTEEEIKNTSHFLVSLEANRAATRIINKALPLPRIVSETDIQEIIRLQKAALREAKLVKDSVLEKAHPELREHFRYEYQKGIELMIESVEAGNAAAQITGSTLLDQWVDWLNSNRKEIRIPKGDA